MNDLKQEVLDRIEEIKGRRSDPVSAIPLEDEEMCTLLLASLMEEEFNDSGKTGK